jgi:hypothetical protein
MFFNIHILAILSTIVFYFLLKSFKKQSLKNDIQNKNMNKKESNLIYILFAPTIVYITYYTLIKKDKNQVQSPSQFLSQIKNQSPNGPVPQIPKIKMQSSDLPSIYPVESTLSSGL